MSGEWVFRFLVVAGVAIQPVLEGVGLLGRWGGGVSALVAGLKRPERSRVAIIRIDHYDLVHLFDSTTPLPPEPLARVVSAVAHSGPTRIGVDIDTSAPCYRGLASLKWGSPVIWAQPADYSHVRRAFFLRGGPLGGDASARSGITVVIADRDGVVRRYHRSYQKVYEGDLDGTVAARQFLQSFPARVAGSPDSGKEDDILIDFRGRERDEWSASDLLGPKAAAIQRELQGRIVLIGSACDTRDEHQTPLGWQNGVEILADAVDTELKLQHGERFAVPPYWITLLCVSLIATATHLLLSHGGGVWYHLAVFGGLIAATMIAAWAAYGSLVSCLFFLPAVCAVSSNFLFEKVRSRQRE